MSRAVWFAAGAVSAAYTLVKARRAARNLTPDGIGARVAALGVSARTFADEVSASMAEREALLRAELRASSAQPRAIGRSSTARAAPEGVDDGHR